MVITVLEAHVPQEAWRTLETAYNAAIQSLDPGIVETYLLHSANNETLWQILTVWESREALDAMRNSGEIPRGVLIFRAAGAQPELKVFLVPAHAARAPV